MRRREGEAVTYQVACAILAVLATGLAAWLAWAIGEIGFQRRLVDVLRAAIADEKDKSESRRS